MAWFEAIKKELEIPCPAETERMNLGDQLRNDPKATASWKLDILNTDKYTRTATRRTAKELFRAFRRTSRSERSPAFIEKARLHLTLLHSYNNIVQMQKKRYPRTKWMFYLLCRYVALEFEGLGPNPDPNNCEAEYLVLVLENILSKYFDVDPEIRSKVFIVYIIVTAYRSYQIPRWYMERLARLVLKGTIIQKQLDDIYSSDDDLLYIGNIWSNDNLKYFMEVDDFATDDEDSDSDSSDQESDDFLKSTVIFPSSSSSESVESEDDEVDDALLINFEKNLLEYDFTRGLKDSSTVRDDSSKEDRGAIHKFRNADDSQFPIVSPHVITIDDDDDDEVLNQHDDKIELIDSDVEVIDCVCQSQENRGSERTKFNFEKSSELIYIDDDDDDDDVASGYSARNFVFSKTDNRSIVQRNSIKPSTINSKADVTGTELPQATSRNQSNLHRIYTKIGDNSEFLSSDFLSSRLDPVGERGIATSTKPKKISSVEIIDCVVKPSYTNLPSITSSTSSIKVKHKTETTSTHPVVLEETSPRAVEHDGLKSSALNISNGENGIAKSVKVKRADSQIRHSNSAVEVIQIERDKIKRSETEQIKDAVAVLPTVVIEDRITQGCINVIAEEKYYQTVDAKNICNTDFLESLHSNAIATKPSLKNINTIRDGFHANVNVKNLKDISLKSPCIQDEHIVLNREAVRFQIEELRVVDAPSIPEEITFEETLKTTSTCIQDENIVLSPHVPKEPSKFQIEELCVADTSSISEETLITTSNILEERLIASPEIPEESSLLVTSKTPVKKSEDIQAPEYNKNRPIEAFLFKNAGNASEGDSTGIEETTNNTSNDLTTVDVSKIKNLPQLQHTLTRCQSEGEIHHPLKSRRETSQAEGDELKTTKTIDSERSQEDKTYSLKRSRETSEKFASNKVKDDELKTTEIIESERSQDDKTSRDIEIMETIPSERPQEDIKAQFETAETVQSERSKEGKMLKDGKPQFEATETVRSEIPRKDKTERSEEDKTSKNGKAQFKTMETVRSLILRTDKTERSVEDKTLKDGKTQFKTMETVRSGIPRRDKTERSEEDKTSKGGKAQFKATEIPSNGIKAQERKDYESRDTIQHRIPVKVLENSVENKLEDSINGVQIKDFARFENSVSSRKMYTSNGVNKLKVRQIEEPSSGSEIIEESSNVEIADEQELAEQKILFLGENSDSEDLQMNNLSSKKELEEEILLQHNKFVELGGRIEDIELNSSPTIVLLEEEILKQHNKSVELGGEIEDIELNSSPTIVLLEEEILKQHNKSVYLDEEIEDIKLNSVPTIISLEEEMLKQHNKSVDSDGEIEDIELNSVPTIISLEEEIWKQHNKSVVLDGEIEDIELNSPPAIVSLEEEILKQHNKSVDSDGEIEDIELNSPPAIVSLEEEILKQHNKSVDSDGEIEDIELNSPPAIVSLEEEILKQHNKSIYLDGEIEDIKLNSVPTITEEEDEELKSVDVINNAKGKSIDTFVGELKDKEENHLETITSESQLAGAAFSHQKIGGKERPKRPSGSDDKMKADKQKESGNLASHQLEESVLAYNKEFLELIATGSVEERQKPKINEEGSLAFAGKKNINEEFLESGSVEHRGSAKIENVKNSQSEDLIIIESGILENPSADEDGPNLIGTSPPDEDYRDINEEVCDRLSMITESDYEEIIQESITNRTVENAVSRESAENKFIPNLNAEQNKLMPGVLREDIFEETISVPDPIVEIEILGEDKKLESLENLTITYLLADTNEEPTRHGGVLKEANTVQISLDMDKFVTTSMYDDKVREIGLTRVSSTSLQKDNFNVQGMEQTNIPTTFLQKGNVEVRGMEQTFTCDNVNIPTTHVSSTSLYQEMKQNKINIRTSDTPATTAGEISEEDTTDCGYAVPEKVLVEDEAVTRADSKAEVMAEHPSEHQNYDLEKIDSRDESAWESLQRNMRVLSYAVETKLIQESRSRVKFSSRRSKESEARSKSRKKNTAKANARPKSGTGNVSKLQSRSGRTGRKGIDENLKPLQSFERDSKNLTRLEESDTFELGRDLKKSAQLEESDIFELERDLKKSAQLEEFDIFELERDLKKSAQLEESDTFKLGRDLKKSAQLEEFDIFELERDSKKSAQLEESDTFERKQLKEKNTTADEHTDFTNKNSNDDSSDSFEGRLVIPDDEPALIDCIALPTTTTTTKKKAAEFQKVEMVPTKMMHEMEIQPEPVPSLAEAVGQFSVCQDVSKFVDDNRKRTNYNMDYILGNVKPEETRRETASLDVDSLPHSVNNLLKPNTRMNRKLINSSDEISKNLEGILKKNARTANFNSGDEIPEEILKKNVRTTNFVSSDEISKNLDEILKKNVRTTNFDSSDEISKNLDEILKKNVRTTNFDSSDDISKNLDEILKKNIRTTNFDSSDEILKEISKRIVRATNLNSKRKTNVDIAKEINQKPAKRQRELFDETKMDARKCEVVERSLATRQPKVIILENVVITPKRTSARKISEIEYFEIEQNYKTEHLRIERNAENPTDRVLVELSQTDDVIVVIEDESKTELFSKPDEQPKKLESSNIDDRENYSVGNETQKQTKKLESSDIDERENYSVEDETQKQTKKLESSKEKMLENYSVEDETRKQTYSKCSQNNSLPIANHGFIEEHRTSEKSEGLPGVPVNLQCENFAPESTKVKFEELPGLSIKKNCDPASGPRLNEKTCENANKIVSEHCALSDKISTKRKVVSIGTGSNPLPDEDQTTQNNPSPVVRPGNFENGAVNINGCTRSSNEQNGNVHTSTIEKCKKMENDVQASKSPTSLQDKPVYRASSNSSHNQSDAFKTGFSKPPHNQSDAGFSKPSSQCLQDKPVHHESSSSSQSGKKSSRKSNSSRSKHNKKTELQTDIRNVEDGASKMTAMENISIKSPIAIKEGSLLNIAISKTHETSSGLSCKSNEQKSTKNNLKIAEKTNTDYTASLHSGTTKVEDKIAPRFASEETKKSHSGIITIEDKTNSVKIKSSHKKKDIDTTGSGKSLRSNDVLEDVEKPLQEKPGQTDEKVDEKDPRPNHDASEGMKKSHSGIIKIEDKTKSVKIKSSHIKSSIDIVDKTGSGESLQRKDIFEDIKKSLQQKPGPTDKKEESLLHRKKNIVDISGESLEHKDILQEKSKDEKKKSSQSSKAKDLVSPETEKSSSSKTDGKAYDRNSSHGKDRGRKKPSRSHREKSASHDETAKKTNSDKIKNDDFELLPKTIVDSKSKQQNSSAGQKHAKEGTPSKQPSVQKIDFEHEIINSRSNKQKYADKNVALCEHSSDGNEEEAGVKKVVCVKEEIKVNEEKISKAAEEKVTVKKLVYVKEEINEAAEDKARIKKVVYHKEEIKADEEKISKAAEDKTRIKKGVCVIKKIEVNKEKISKEAEEKKLVYVKEEVKANEETISKAAEDKARTKEGVHVKEGIKANEEKISKAAEAESCEGNSNLYKRNGRDEVKTHKRKRAEDNEQEINFKLENLEEVKPKAKSSCPPKEQKDAEKLKTSSKFKTESKKPEVASKKSVTVIAQSAMQTEAVEGVKTKRSSSVEDDGKFNADEKSKTGKIIADDGNEDEDGITNKSIAGEEAEKFNSKGGNLAFNKSSSSENFTRHKRNAREKNSRCVEEKASDDLLGNKRLQIVISQSIGHPEQSTGRENKLGNISASFADAAGDASGRIAEIVSINSNVRTISTKVSESNSTSAKHTKSKPPATEALITNDAAASPKKKKDQGKILSSTSPPATEASITNDAAASPKKRKDQGKILSNTSLKNNAENFQATKNNEMVTNRSSSCEVSLVHNKAPVEGVATNDESSFAPQAANKNETDTKTKTSGKRSAEEILGEHKKKPRTDANKCKSRETSKLIDNIINSLRDGRRKRDCTKEENSEKRIVEERREKVMNEELKTRKQLDSPDVIIPSAPKTRSIDSLDVIIPSASENVIQPVPRSEVDLSVTAAPGNMIQPEVGFLVTAAPGNMIRPEVDFLENDDEPVFDGMDGVFRQNPTSSIIDKRVATSSTDICFNHVSTLGFDESPFGEGVKKEGGSGTEELSGTQPAVANQDLSEQAYITSEDIFVPIVGKEETIAHDGEAVYYYSGEQPDPRLSNIVCNRPSVMNGLSNNSQSQRNAPRVSEILTQLNAQGHSFPLANLGLADMEGINYNEVIWSPEAVMKAKENFTPDTVKEIFLNKGDSTKSFEDGVLQTPRIIPAALESADELNKKETAKKSISQKLKFYVKPKLSEELQMRDVQRTENIIADKANVKLPVVDISKSKRKVEIDGNASKQNHRKRLSSQTETEVEKNENVKRSKNDDGYCNDLFDSLKKSDPKTLPLPSASSLGNNQDKSVKNSGNVRKPDELVKDVARKKTKPNVIGREEQEIYKKPTERRHSIVSGQSRKHTPDTSRNSKSVPYPMNPDKYKYHPGHSSGSVSSKRIPHQDNRYRRHEPDSRSHADPSAKIDGRHRHRHYGDVPNSRVHGPGYYGSAHNRPLYTGLSVGSPHDRNWRDSYLDAHHYNWEEVTFPLPNLRKPSVQHQQQSSEAHKEWYENFDKVFPRREDITFTIKKTDDGRN